MNHPQWVSPYASLRALVQPTPCEKQEGGIAVAPVFKILRRARSGFQDPSNLYSREVTP